MAVVEIYDTENTLWATVNGKGKVTPGPGRGEETITGIRRHVGNMKADGLRGRKLLERIERSWTNGHFIARTV